MLGENLKNLRRAKGLSQEELAQRLHVVRQTISKWESGLSVPDADALIAIAEIFETTVSALLGEKIEEAESTDAIAQKLEQLNHLLAERNRRNRRIWRVVAGVLIAAVLIMMLSVIFGRIAFTEVKEYDSVNMSIEGEVNADVVHLAETIEQMDFVSAAVVTVDEENQLVSVTVETVQGKKITEVEVERVHKLVENTLKESESATVIFNRGN